MNTAILMQSAQSSNIVHADPLAALFLKQKSTIEAWFQQQWDTTPSGLMSSVDVRYAGFKLAPVDTNLFPAGFNNLHANSQLAAASVLRDVLNSTWPSANKLLLIPESHTRNRFYMRHLYCLSNLLKEAGYEVRIGSLMEDLSDTYVVELDDGQSLHLEPLMRRANRIGLADYDPDIVILNNDLSSGTPQILQGIEQALTPSLRLGWDTRLKSEHFAHYQTVCQELAEGLGVDPWLFNALFRVCQAVDFMQREGEACLLENAEQLFASIQRKYREHGIAQDPFVVVKADAGTYGMGVMMVHNVDELKSLNRKQRVRMSATKGKKKLDKVILQEGVPSCETWQGASAESVLYLIGAELVGGFYRLHPERDAKANLNAPGMQFVPIDFPSIAKCADALPQHIYPYSVVARLAVLAAAREALWLK